MKKIYVAIIGGSGYGGGELLRLLLFHDNVEISFVTSRRNAGKFVYEVHPNLRNLTELKFVNKPIEEIADEVDLLFFATPNGVAMQEAPKIIGKTRIIDTSADFRLKNLEEFKHYYGKHECPELIEKFAYGLTEFNKETIKKARYIANPGCFATGALLAIIPLAKEGLLKNLVIDSKTGSSGSGADPSITTHHPERAMDFRAYNVLSHRHYLEIYQELKKFNTNVDFSFVPHSTPMIRGIFTTCYSFLDKKITKEELSDIYRKYYANEYFVRLVESPRCSIVAGTNFCDIGFACNENRVVVMSAIDNLVKGDAGQAIQNMNVMFNFDEKTGLEFPGMHP